MVVKAKGKKSPTVKKKAPSTKKGSALRLEHPGGKVRKSSVPDDWEVRDAISTLERAESIKQDSKMMKHVEAATKRLSIVVSNAKKKERT